MNNALIAFQVWAEPALTPRSNQDIICNSLEVVGMAKGSNRPDFEVCSYRASVSTAMRTAFFADGFHLLVSSVAVILYIQCDAFT
jgi:hypothetical protein